MLKFKYNYQNNTLAYQTKTTEESTWYQLTEEQQFEGKFGSQGFNLSDGQVICSVYQSKIRAFYKKRESGGSFVCFRKDLPKECPVIFTFTNQDQIQKLANQWVKKGDNHELN